VEYKCLVRATDGKRKISTALTAKELPRFQDSYTTIQKVRVLHNFMCAAAVLHRYTTQRRFVLHKRCHQSDGWLYSCAGPYGCAQKAGASKEDRSSKAVTAWFRVCLHIVYCCSCTLCNFSSDQGKSRTLGRTLKRQSSRRRDIWPKPLAWFAVVKKFSRFVTRTSIMQCLQDFESMEVAANGEMEDICLVNLGCLPLVTILKKMGVRDILNASQVRCRYRLPFWHMQAVGVTHPPVIL
jgi:hypothetical protein